MAIIACFSEANLKQNLTGEVGIPRCPFGGAWNVFSSKHQCIQIGYFQSFLLYAIGQFGNTKCKNAMIAMRWSFLLV